MIDISNPVDWSDPVNQGLKFWGLYCPEGWQVTRPLYAPSNVTTSFVNTSGKSEFSSALDRAGGYRCQSQNEPRDYTSLSDGMVNTAGTACGWMLSTTRIWSLWRETFVWKSRNWNIGTYGSGATRYIRFRKWDGGGAGTYRNYDTSAIPTGWFWIASVFSNNGSFDSYINGVLVDSKTYTTAETQIGFSAEAGSYSDKTAAQADWTGPYRIDDVRLYDRALSEADIVNLYNQSRLGYPTALRRFQTRRLSIPSGGGGGGAVIPIFDHHYRMMRA